MALEIRCPNCDRKLRIAEEHAGKQVRCPACQQISTAPIGATDSESSAAATAAENAATWHLKTPEGPIYGPITWPMVQSWAAEGRIAADCQLAESRTGPWHEAGELLPQLRPSPKPASVGSAAPATHPWMSPEPGEAGGGGNPYSAPGTAAIGSYVAPHRGGLILVLGLIGFAISCPIFSLMAWVMGSHDLHEMRAGRMDRSGEGLTQAGQVLGMILSLLWILLGVGALIIFVIAAVLTNL
jgi:phage FluMu protein Com